MKLIKFALILTFAFLTNLNADTPHFIDFKYVLNESSAGKKAQKDLKTELENGLKSLKVKEKKIQEDEKNNSTKKVN